MKKKLSVLLVMIMALSCLLLCGCGDSKESSGISKFSGGNKAQIADSDDLDTEYGEEYYDDLNGFDFDEDYDNDSSCDICGDSYASYDYSGYSLCYDCYSDINSYDYDDYYDDLDDFDFDEDYDFDEYYDDYDDYYDDYDYDDYYDDYDYDDYYDYDDDYGSECYICGDSYASYDYYGFNLCYDCYYDMNYGY